MGQVIRLETRSRESTELPRRGAVERNDRTERARRVSITLRDPLLGEVEREARRHGVSVADFMRMGAGYLADRFADQRRANRP